MKFKLFLVATVLFGLSSCGFNQSAKIDLTTGLTSKGDGLASSDVYLSINDDKITKTTFTYGEVFYVNFRNTTGFIKENGNVFPGMEILVLSKSGDTAMYYQDMYADKIDGVAIYPLYLYANITVAKPMNSDKEYSLYVKIWDKKGKGTLTAEMDFNVVANEHFKIEKSKQVSVNDIYLFGEKRAIIDKHIKLNEKYYFFFEGLKGFKDDAGKVSVGMSVNAKDKTGYVLVNAPDLFGDEEFDKTALEEQISANITFTEAKFTNPVTCEVIIWDKKSDAKIKTLIDLELK
jgi:hypothetical protein